MVDYLVETKAHLWADQRAGRKAVMRAAWMVVKRVGLKVA
jgi:hypothetical protein